MKFSEITQRLQAVDSSLTTYPDRNPELTGVAAIDKAAADAIGYIDGKKFAAYVNTTQAGALILPVSDVLQQQASDRGIPWLSVSYPRLAFAQAIALFYQPYAPPPGVHPTAVIHPSATLGREVAIGAHAVVEAQVTVGNGVCIHPNVVVYPEATIGDRTVLHANCTIHERSRIGADCVIHSGVVIGAEGFGFVPTREGWVKMEQSGLVVLEDRVEIGCNSAVDRPAVGETHIAQDTKLDNLVHIAHGCTIGRGCAMAAQGGLAGGVTVGDRVIFAGQVGVTNQATIGNGATLTARTAAINDVEPGATISGYPPMPHAQWLRSAVLQRRLPELQKTLHQLQSHMQAQTAQIEQLQAQIDALQP
ncbi:MAG: UDP-3-O-(3-hydroxymyristoyl)glucosamine N-acyltransferase [Elainellaceae cyanobacterium]